MRLGTGTRSWAWAALLLVTAASTARPGHDTPVMPVEVTEAVREDLKAADRAFLGGDLSAAQVLYGRVLEQAPGLRRALWGRATALFRLHRDYQARPLLEEALGPDPTFDEVMAAARLVDVAARDEPSPARAAAAREFLGRAARAVARGAPDPAGEPPLRLESRAWLAMTLGRDEEAVRAWDSLAAQQPYCYAYALGDSLAARQPTTAAPAAGIPPPAEEGAWGDVEWFLGGILVIALAWAAGLLALYVLGKGLSGLMLRLVDLDGRGLPIPRRQRPLRVAYRVVIWAAGLYYFVSLGMLVVLVLTVPGSIFYGLATTPRVPGSAMWAAIPLCLTMIVLGAPILRSLRVKYMEQADGRPLKESEAPALWALVRDVARRVGTRPVDEIRLITGADIAVHERGRWRDKKQGRSVRSLLLGMATFDGFSAEAFRAVVAHEYAHFLHRDTAGQEIARRVHANLSAFAGSILQWGGNAWWNVGWHFARMYHALFRRITLGALRLQEVHADRVAALSCGPRPAADGLLHTIRRGAEHRFDQERAFREALIGPGVWESPLRSSAAMRSHAVREIIRREMETPAGEDATHPSPSRRLELLRAIEDEARGMSDSRSAEGPPGDDLWALFADPERARAEFRRRCEAEVQARLDQHAVMAAQVTAHFTAAIHDNPDQAAPYLARADAHFELGDDQAARADYDEAIARDPQSAVAYFHRGLARRRLGDDAGAAEDFRAAMRIARVAFEPAVRALLGDIAARAGDLPTALLEYGRSLDLDRTNADVLLKRGNARARIGQPSVAIKDFTRALELDPESAEAFVARSEAYMALGEPARARADAERAVAIDPGLAEAHVLLARVLLKGTGPDADGRRVGVVTSLGPQIGNEPVAAISEYAHEKV